MIKTTELIWKSTDNYPTVFQYIYILIKGDTTSHGHDRVYTGRYTNWDKKKSVTVYLNKDFKFRFNWNEVYFWADYDSIVTHM